MNNYAYALKTYIQTPVENNNSAKTEHQNNFYSDNEHLCLTCYARCTT